MAKNTNRLGRVNEELRKEISNIINYELKKSRSYRNDKCYKKLK